MSQLHASEPYARRARRMRENPATADARRRRPAIRRPTPSIRDAPAIQLTPAHADAIEIFAEVLAQSEEEGLADDFYSRLCEGITRCTALRRVVIFRYDSTRRRILAAGASASTSTCSAATSSRSSRPSLAREALEQDRVLETAEDLEQQAAGRSTSSGCRRAPSSARRSRRAGAGSGRSSATAAARARRSPTPEREVLWILGKMAALAAMARAATRQHERAVALEQRIDLAREVHEGVVQRLFGVSLALSGEQPFDEQTRRRCAEEVQAALGDLRTAMQRPLGRSARGDLNHARPRRSSACATSTRRSASRWTTAPSWRRRPRSSRSPSPCSPRRSATPTSTPTPRASACAAS